MGGIDPVFLEEMVGIKRPPPEQPKPSRWGWMGYVVGLLIAGVALGWYFAARAQAGYTSSFALTGVLIAMGVMFITLLTAPEEDVDAIAIDQLHPRGTGHFTLVSLLMGPDKEPWGILAIRLAVLLWLVLIGLLMWRHGFGAVIGSSSALR